MSTIPQYFQLSGSLDLSSAPMMINPGDALECINFIPGLNGGYQYIGGYERFDGRKAPSSAKFWELEVLSTATISIGDSIQGGASNASAVVIEVVSDTFLVVTELTGAFQIGEAVNSTSVTGEAILLNADTNAELDHRRHLAANHYRAKIQAVPGSGPVLGVFRHLSATYAVRNNASGNASVIHKATSSGWLPLPLKSTLKFKAGKLLIEEGMVISDGTSTAMVMRVLINSGSWTGGTAEGYFVIDPLSGSGFKKDAALKLGSASCATADSDVTQIALKPSGRFDFEAYNFKGSSDGFRVYAADGVNHAIEIDQNGLVVPIFSKDETDNPAHICEHNGRLFLGFNNGQVHHSVAGEPWNYSVALGAGQRGLGAPVTGLSSQSSGVLIMTTRRKTFVLQGSSNKDWVQNVAAETAGAYPHTLQTISDAFALDDRGVVQLSRTAAFGGFESGSITRKIQRLIDRLKPLAISSTVIRRLNQYWLFFSDGTGLAFYPINTADGMSVRVTQFDYGKAVRCICNAEDETGAERILFGSDDGFVYEAQRGTSFDGGKIESFVRLSFNHFKSPRVRKRWRKLLLELSADSNVSLSVTPDIDFSSPNISTPSTQVLKSFGGGGYWDSSSWDEFTWDSEAVSVPEIPLTGSGTNLSFLIHQESAVTQPFTIHGAIVHFDPRRLER